MKPLYYIFISILFAFQGYSQQGPVQLSLGNTKTTLEQEAINFGISYLKSLDSIWESQEYLITGDKSIFVITPDIDIKSGNADAFSSMNIKATGLVLLFDTTHVAGLVTPNSSKLFHALPISIGLETNNRFDILNGLLETGWVPWYQTKQRKTAAWLKKTKIGFFVQGGYKFSLDTNNTMPIGGAKDESSELPNDAILRGKGIFAIDTKSLFSIGGVGLGVKGESKLWYDILNSDWYYNIDAKLRFYLDEDRGVYFDMQYQKGSGAPNFNEGEQYGINLTVSY